MCRWSCYCINTAENAVMAISKNETSPMVQCTIKSTGGSKGQSTWHTACLDSKQIFIQMKNGKDWQKWRQRFGSILDFCKHVLEIGWKGWNWHLFWELAAISDNHFLNGLIPVIQWHYSLIPAGTSAYLILNKLTVLLFYKEICGYLPYLPVLFFYNHNFIIKKTTIGYLICHHIFISK